MTSLRTRINRIVGPILANRYTGIIAAKLLRDRIPHRGLTIDTSDPVVTPEIKAALLLGGYESGEYRFVQRHLPRDVDVVELGGSLGVISCTTRRAIAPERRMVIVEADPRLANSLRRNLALNGCETNTTVAEVAISYGGGDTVAFAMGESSVSGRIASEAPDLQTVQVPARTLSGLLDEHGITDFALISDIEGVEWQILRHDLDALARARIIIMETHDSREHGTHQQLVATLLDSGRFRLLDSHGPVVALQPVTAHG